MTTFEPGAALEVAAPPVAVADAERLARELFGIAGSATPLHGERDRNFHLRAAEGGEYVLKVAHPAEDPAVLALQDGALRHVARRDPGLPVPRVIAPVGEREGAAVWWAEEVAPRVVRVLTYLSGRPLGGQVIGPAELRMVGDGLARLDQALAGFRHPAEGHDLLWDLQKAARVRGLLHVLPPERRALPLRFLDRLEGELVPLLPSLPQQLVHNDLNPSNVLVAADGAGLGGIIDFGDMVRAPRVQDLATAAAYGLAGSGRVLEGAAAMVGAYHARTPLEPGEWAVLPGLIGARLALTIAVSSWRADRHPDNAAYIMRNQERAWTGLSRLAELPETAVREALRA